jgi:hypothetical protein
VITFQALAVLCLALSVFLATACAAWFFCIRKLEDACELLTQAREALTVAESELSFPVSRGPFKAAHKEVLASLRALEQFERGVA